MAIYSQSEIDALIACPKKVSEPPKKEMSLVGADFRNDMKLVSSSGFEGEFLVFIRKSEDFQENFSVGLRYQPKDDRGEITLLRCNGPHGGCNGEYDPDHPHWTYHVHRASEDAIANGGKAEKYAEKTSAYGSFEEAIRYFLNAISLDTGDACRYFPKEMQTQLIFETGSPWKF